MSEQLLQIQSLPEVATSVMVAGPKYNVRRVAHQHARHLQLHTTVRVLAEATFNVSIEGFRVPSLPKGCGLKLLQRVVTVNQQDSAVVLQSKMTTCVRTEMASVPAA